MITAIRGGTVVTPAGAFSADVVIDGEIITAVGHGVGADATDVIDATGCLVLPGCVDMHTHMAAATDAFDESEFGTSTCDDFRAGTRAAAAGGTTTIIDFACQVSEMGLEESVDIWEQGLLARPPAVDVGLHMIVTDMSAPSASDEVRALCDRGVTSFKVFMAYRDSPLSIDDGTLVLVAQAVGAAGGVVLVHAENGDAIEVLRSQALLEGRTAAIDHALTRPPVTEAEAVNRAISLCHMAGSPVYFMHVSCSEAAATIARARGEGLDVHGETCPQYLAFTDDVLRQGASEAAKYVFTPPPRPEGHRDSLWAALRSGVLEVVSTDHAPYTTAQKAAAANFLEIPNGAPGVENRLEVMYELGVRQGRLGLDRLVELLCAAPARLFGLYPRKGSLNPGSDADIVVFDPARARTIRATDQVSTCDYSLYEGLEVGGSVRDVLFRGELMVKDGALIGPDDRGRFIARDRWRSAC